MLLSNIVLLKLKKLSTAAKVFSKAKLLLIVVKSTKKLELKIYNTEFLMIFSEKFVSLMLTCYIFKLELCISISVLFVKSLFISMSYSLSFEFFSYIKPYVRLKN